MAGRQNSEKELFAAKILYDFSSINRLSLTISKCCRLHFRFLLYALGFVLVLFSLYTQMNSSIGIFILVIGCFMITSVNAPAKMRAKQSWASIGSKTMTGFYKFFEHDFYFSASGQNTQMEYGGIQRLIEDDEYLYLFTNNTSAYMIEKSSLRPDFLQFKTFLVKKTSISWKHPFSLLSFRFYSFRKK